VMASMLLRDSRQAEIPLLEAPRITRMRGSSFLLVGLERVDHRKETHHYPQAWWCRLPAEAQGPRLNLSPTLNREKKRQARMERG